MNTKVPSIGIRWFNDACYQIRLPNEKVILIDPYIDRSPLKALGSDALDRVDYIFISHTHFDHVLDLKNIVSRFGSQVYAGAMSAVELARQYDLPGHLLTPCHPNESFPLDDFELHCYSGKHTPLGDMDRPSHWPQNILDENLDPETTELNMLGSFEYINFVIELPQHIRILIWGGAASSTAVRMVKDYRPNISIAQLPRETPEQIAELYSAIGGQFIFPHHHDSYMQKGPAGMAVIDAVAKKTKEIAPDTQLVLPEKGKWYTIAAQLSCVEE